MKRPELNGRNAARLALLFSAAARLAAHSWHDEGPVSPAIAAARAELMAQLVAEQRAALASAASAGGTPGTAAAPVAPAGYGATMTASFSPFKPHVRTYHDATTFYVEGDGMPDPALMPTPMVGITAW